MEVVLKSCENNGAVDLDRVFFAMVADTALCCAKSLLCLLMAPESKLFQMGSLSKETAAFGTEAEIIARLPIAAGGKNKAELENKDAGDSEDAGDDEEDDDAGDDQDDDGGDDSGDDGKNEEDEDDDDPEVNGEAGSDDDDDDDDDDDGDEDDVDEDDDEDDEEDEEEEDTPPAKKRK